MSWFGASPPPAAAAQSTSATPSPADDAHFASLLQQERIIQSAALPAADMPSCMALFDTMTSCFGECRRERARNDSPRGSVADIFPSPLPLPALVPQLRHVYRYGGMNECAQKVDDWKFCLSLKGRGDVEKRQAWIERKARAMARRRMPGGDTSEEVWSIREQPIIEPDFVDPAFLPGARTEDKSGAT